MAKKEEPHDVITQNTTQTLPKHTLDETGSLSDAADMTGSLSDAADMRCNENDPRKKNVVKKRKKNEAVDESYHLNRTMRDKDFKLARSNFYSFKDTLGKSAFICSHNSLLIFIHLSILYISAGKMTGIKKTYPKPLVVL